MTRTFRTAARFAFAAGTALALAACGSSEHASEEAQADTVEIPSDEAMSGVTETPVADETGMQNDVAVRSNLEQAQEKAQKAQQDAQSAGEAAAAAAADVQAAAEAAAQGGDAAETTGN